MFYAQQLDGEDRFIGSLDSKLSNFQVATQRSGDRSLGVAPHYSTKLTPICTQASAVQHHHISFGVAGSSPLKMNSTDAIPAASVSLGSEQNSRASASSLVVFAQLKGFLEAAEAKVAGYDELSSLLETEQRSVSQLQRALQMQQRQIDDNAAKERLVSQLSRHLAEHAQALERLQPICCAQEKQLQTAEERIVVLQHENQRKRLKLSDPAPAFRDVPDSNSNSNNKRLALEQRNHVLERRLQAYQSICSYVAVETQVELSLPAPLHRNVLLSPQTWLSL